MKVLEMEEKQKVIEERLKEQKDIKEYDTTIKKEEIWLKNLSKDLQ